MLAVGSALLVSHAPSFSSLFTPFTSFFPLSFTVFCYHFFPPVLYLSSLTNQPFSFLFNWHFVHLLSSIFLIFLLYCSSSLFVLSDTNIILQLYRDWSTSSYIYARMRCLIDFHSVLLITTLLHFEERIQIASVIFVSWLFLLYSFHIPWKDNRTVTRK